MLAAWIRKKRKVVGMTIAPRPRTEIDAIAESWVDELVVLAPTLGTYIGRSEVDGRMPDLSPEGAGAFAEAERRTLASLERAAPVDAVDEVTKADLAAELRLSLARHEAGEELRDLNVIASPPQDLRDVFDLMPRETEEHWAVVAQRTRSLPAALAGYRASLSEGARRGLAPAARQVAEVAPQARRVAGVGSEGEASGFFAALATQAGSRGSGSDHADGAPLSQSLLAEIVGESLEAGSVAKAIAKLDADPARKLHGTEALQQWMQQTSDRAVAELADTQFDIPVEIRTLECMIAPTQEGGIYYTGPSDDFSRPGRMWWSVPEGVTEFDTWRELTTVYHEGVSGHHLQIGSAVVNRGSLNEWRRQLAGTSGHAEGWALYAERLMEQLGYLDDPADRFGMLDGQRIWEELRDDAAARAAAAGEAFDIRDFHRRALSLGGVRLDTLQRALA